MRMRVTGRVATALGALAVAALLGGMVTIAVRMPGQTYAGEAPPAPPSAAVNPALLLPTKPRTRPLTPPTPWQTPSEIDWVIPDSVSFANARAGWVTGRGCDLQQRCQPSVARSTDGGATWALVTSPLAVRNDAWGLRVTAASAADAWAWGSTSTAGPIFSATHDGGRTWQAIDGGPGEVTALAVAGGTVWAETGCATSPDTCTVRLVASSVRGGPWTPLGVLPVSVQGGGQLVRTGRRAWVLGTRGSQLRQPALVRSDDGGHSWTSLPMPCQPWSMTLAASSDSHLVLACALDGGWPAPQEVWSSHDGGGHWTLRSRSGVSVRWPEFPDTGSLHNSGAPVQLAAVDDRTTWMANLREDDLVTHDDGVSWTPAALPNGPFSSAGGAEGVTFVDALHGWTYSSAGLWATVDGGVHWTQQAVIGIPRF
jgi:hypothetical protein